MISAVVELLIFSAAALLYRRTLRHRGHTAHQASAAIGLRWGRPQDYGAAVPVLGLGWGLGYGALRMIPLGQLTHRGVTVGTTHTASGALAIVVLALAEEVFFRGLLAGLLIRWLGFPRGNALQALIFLAPHCLLLLAGTTLWPILPAQLIAGWLLGWLRDRSGSIGPPALAHAAANLLAALMI